MFRKRCSLSSNLTPARGQHCTPLPGAQKVGCEMQWPNFRLWVSMSKQQQDDEREERTAAALPRLLVSCEVSTFPLGTGTSREGAPAVRP